MHLPRSPLPKPMSSWVYSKDIYYWKYWTNSPARCPSPFSSSSSSCTHQIQPSFLFTLLNKISLIRAQGRGRTADGHRPFLSCAGEDQFICPSTQYNFPRASRAEPAFSWITNRARLRGVSSHQALAPFLSQLRPPGCCWKPRRLYCKFLGWSSPRAKAWAEKEAGWECSKSTCYRGGRTGHKIRSRCLRASVV